MTHRLGLRMQILLALAGILLMSYVPLFFAIAGVTRATLLASRERAARSLGRAIAAHVADAEASGAPGQLSDVLGSHAGEGGARALAIFGADGRRVAGAGNAEELAALRVPQPPYRESSGPARGVRGRAFDVVVPDPRGVVVIRFGTDDETVNATPLVKVVALYMLVFALALLVFAYFVLTRLLVRPIEEVSAATDRVASGARTFSIPKRGAREVVDLAVSVDAMATRLLDDDRKLRAKVDELVATTRRLTEAQEHLARSERLASVGRLAAGLAHEIGNPLTAIMGMHELVEDPSLPAEERSDFLSRMKRETERIHGVLRDLLDFARPEASQGEAQGGCLVAEVAADVNSLALPQKSFREVELIHDLGEPGLAVGLSAARLTQVLLNLVMNAGAELEASSSPKRTIFLRARREGKTVRIEVEDTGRGVPEELRARIFEPFVTTKEVGEGTGLGLAVCRGIVEAAGGTIVLDPKYMHGARFVIHLPSAAGADVSPESRRPRSR